ncbi:MAG: glutathione S-transferase family protein [Stagnimonas sp.]|nr:glutathione S-transferase family protein [Stagnimonas sp.]
MSLQLYQFPRTGRLPNDSPFCLKAETYLRLVGLPYETVTAPPFKSPTGKLPMLVDERRKIPDSSAIVAHLEAQLGPRALDAGLSATQRAQSHLIQRTVEEHLYWSLLWLRWIDTAGWRATRTAFFGSIPPGPRHLIGGLIRRKVARDARGHGLALHSRAEILHRATQDLAALSALLGEQDYFLGAEPHAIDATAYGFLGNILDSDLRTALTDIAASYSNLVAYCRRMQRRCFPELS